MINQWHHYSRGVWGHTVVLKHYQALHTSYIMYQHFVIVNNAQEDDHKMVNMVCKTLVFNVCINFVCLNLAAAKDLTICL